LRYYEQSLLITRKAGYKIGEGITLDNIAVTWRAHGDYIKAFEYHEQALAICREMSDRAGEAVTRWNLGLTYEDISDLAKAEEHISQAVQIAEQIGHPKLQRFRDGLARVRAKRRG
jgi:tetratricopeptide (TPR) repeat protein